LQSEGPTTANTRCWGKEVGLRDLGKEDQMDQQSAEVVDRNEQRVACTSVHRDI